MKVSGIPIQVLWRILLIIPGLFSVVLAHNAMLYFTHGGEYGILPEKALARADLMWNIAFYIHLPAGVVCLLLPLILFQRSLHRSLKVVHQRLGKIYVFATLALVCPTGLYLAIYAKGGTVTQVGFVLQGLLLGYFTLQAFRYIRSGNRTQHIHYVIRSYAMAAVVLSFRILHILFFLLRVPYTDNYGLSQWLGLAGNLFIAELIIYLQQRKFKAITVPKERTVANISQ